jgi:hypothetical protein
VDIKGRNTDDRRKGIIDAKGKDWFISNRKVTAIRGEESSKAARVNQIAEKSLG